MRNALTASAALASLLLCGTAMAQAQRPAGGAEMRGGASEKGAAATSDNASPKASEEKGGPSRAEENKGRREQTGQKRDESGAAGKQGAQKEDERQSGPERRGGRPQQAGEQRKSEPDKPARAEEKERNAPGRAERNERSAPGRAEQGDQRNQPGRAEQGDQRNQPGRAEQGDQRNQPGRAEQGDQRNAPGRAEQGGQPGRMQQGERDRAGPSPANRAGDSDRNPTGTVPNARTGAAGDQGGSTATRVNLDTRQQTKVRDFVQRDRSATVSRVDFDINVGVRVPDHVHYRPLPGQIVEIVPQYRGYDYFVANDEVVIVEPRTRKIVTVLPAGGNRGGHHARIEGRERKTVYEQAIRDARPISRKVDVRVGEAVPDFVELEPLPQTIVSDVPEIRDYRYFVINREVVLVDPQTRDVVEVIRE